MSVASGTVRSKRCLANVIHADVRKSGAIVRAKDYALLRLRPYPRIILKLISTFTTSTRASTFIQRLLLIGIKLWLSFRFDLFALYFYVIRVLRVLELFAFRTFRSYVS